MSWADFVREYRIPHRKGSGNNNIEINCPLCEGHDPSFHMGLHLESGNWGCWRDRRHRGKIPTKLIRALLRCTWEEAQQITSQHFQLGTLKTNEWHREAFKTLDPPKEFHRFDGESTFERQFVRYLERRNLDPKFCINRFDLHWTIADGYRVIHPVKLRGQWFSWVGRALNLETQPRYKVCPGQPVNNFLFDQDNLTGGDCLIITEGVYDAMSVVSCFIPGVQATSLFGKNVTLSQIKALVELSDQYDRIILALDKEAYLEAVREAQRLVSYVPNLCVRSPSEKDFNSTPPAQLEQEIRRMIA